MARIRSIKPSFYRHEGLQKLEKDNPGAYIMLVFSGLWTISDRAGRFEWRPNVLKLDILPFLDFKMERTLHLLQEAKFIQWYEVEDKQYGCIPTWDKHQKGESLKNEDIRCPDPITAEFDLFGALPGQLPDKSGNVPGAIREGIRNGNGNKEREWNKIPAWKTDLKIYQEEAEKAFKAALADLAYLAERKKYHKRLNIRLTIEKAFNDFWGQEEGWNYKKQERIKTINWRNVINNAIANKMNWVYE